MNKKYVLTLLVLGSVALVGCVPGMPNSQTSNTSTSNTSSNDELTVSNGDAKSSSWPSDIPTLDAGYDFEYTKAGSTYYLGYKVSANKNAGAIADDLTSMMRSAGWSVSADSKLETEDGVLMSFEKSGSTTVLTVGRDSSDTNIYQIGMISGPDSTSY